MPENSIHILSTKIIGDSVADTSSVYNIHLDQVAFIKTEEVTNGEIAERIQQLSLESHFVVFTSLNTINAVSKFVHAKTSWKIFCIAQKTKQAVEATFGTDSVVASAPNGKELAEKIIANPDVKKIIFFCGNQRRDEIPQAMNQHGIDTEEITVYNTIETPSLISKRYDAILFFSPSGVRSFFSVNTIDYSSKIFAIGSTTATEFKKYSSLPVIVSEETLAESLACQAIKHFVNLKKS